MEPLESRLALSSSVPGAAAPIQAAEPHAAAFAIPDVLARGAGNFDSPSTGPDLQPHTPSGWDDSIVVAKVPGTTRDTQPLVFDTSDTIYFDVAAVNAGTASSGRFMIDLALDGVVTQRMSSPSLDASSPVVGQDITSGKLPAGQHTVELIVDSQSQVIETDETNNRYARTFNVSENSMFRPDLRVQSIAVRDQSGSSSISGNDSVFLEIVVVNAGSGAAGLFDIDLRLDGTSLFDRLSPGSGVLQPGETAVIENIGIGTLSPGPHRVDALVDPPTPEQPRGQVQESNETNNFRQGTLVTVTGAVNERPDLTFSLLSGSTQSLAISAESSDHIDSFPILTSDQHVYVDVGVGNAGSASASAFSTRVTLDGVLVRDIRRDTPLNALGSAADFFDIDLGPLSGGTHTLQVTIDPLGNVGESNETNNVLQRRFSVLQPATISGAGWEDLDGDGQRDAGEPGLAGALVYLDVNDNGQLDSGEPRATTRADAPGTLEDETGTYSFTGLAPGTYVVAQQLPAGRQQTVPGPDSGEKSGFDIDLRFLDSAFSPRQQDVVRAAARRWEEVVIGDLPDMYTTVPHVNPGFRSESDVAGLFVDDLLIDVFAEAIDGRPASGTNVLGQGGPAMGTGIDRVDGLGLPTRGTLQIDRADLTGVTDDDLYSVALHEIGHVLGVGTRWDAAGLLDSRSPNDMRYTGRAATDQYNSIFDNNAASIPAHGDGGHWREATFGAELMSPLVEYGTVPLSRITAASLEDLGYSVDLNQADPYMPPGMNRPLVSVMATDAVAAEGLNDTGQFRVERTGPLGFPLTVVYTITGTAATNDFQPIPTSVVFPAGRSTVTIPVLAIDDTTPEPTESVVLTIAASNTYTVGSPYRAVVQIADNELLTGPQASFTHQVTVGSGEAKHGVDFGNRRADGASSGLFVEIAGATPQIRAGAVDAMTIVFSRPVNGFDRSDLLLRRSTDSSANVSLASATLTTTDNITWTLGNLRGITVGSGIYELTLRGNGSNIQDSNSAALGQGDSTRWTNGAGDSNRDRRFDQLDIVAALRAGRYLTGLTATWSQGDWNGDGLFSQMDIVVAQQTQPSHYLQGSFG